MSATNNNDVTNDDPTKGLSNQGEFSSRVKPSERLGEPKHAVGSQKGNNAPDFHAEQYPPGTAPAKDTYKPNPDPVEDVPAGLDGSTQPTNASDTLGGATSLDVDGGLGKPYQGQSSKELRDNTKGRQGGLEGVGGQPLRMPDEALNRSLNK